MTKPAELIVECPYRDSNLLGTKWSIQGWYRAGTLPQDSAALSQSAASGRQVSELTSQGLMCLRSPFAKENRPLDVGHSKVIVSSNYFGLLAGKPGGQ